MNEILTNTYFKELCIPLISVFLTVAIKVVSRRDSFIQPTRDDFAIGFDLFVTSLILIVTYSSKIAIDIHNNQATNKEVCQKKLEVLPWILLFGIMFVWALSVIVRLYGWQTNQSRILKIWPGIIIPALLGFLALVLTVKFIE